MGYSLNVLSYTGPTLSSDTSLIMVMQISEKIHKSGAVAHTFNLSTKKQR